jgi:hypothetical protein
LFDTGAGQRERRIQVNGRERLSTFFAQYARCVDHRINTRQQRQPAFGSQQSLQVAFALIGCQRPTPGTHATQHAPAAFP